MNNVILMGRLTADPTTTTTETTTIAKYNIAVDRYSKDKGTDFIPCVAFGKSADFAEKYLKKGMKICVSGRIQTGSYTHKDGYNVYTTDIVVNNQEFCESKQAQPQPQPEKSSEFVNVPDNIELPFM